MRKDKKNGKAKLENRIEKKKEGTSKPTQFFTEIHKDKSERNYFER